MMANSHHVLWRQRPMLVSARLAGWMLAPLNAWLCRFQPLPVEAQWTWRSPNWRGSRPLTIAFLSDLHAGPATSRQLLELVIARMVKIQPDLILLGGDYFFGNLDDAEWLGGLLSQLRPRMGVFGVLGNHDYWLGCDRVVHMLETSGIRVLRNRGLRIEGASGSLWLGGVDDLWERHADPFSALAGRNPDEPCILLSHNPDLVPEFRPPCELVLSGHTHGGQVRFGPFVLYSNSKYGARFATGWSRIGDTLLYVSRGVGNVEVALRFGAPAEITILRLLPRHSTKKAAIGEPPVAAEVR